MKDDKTYPFIKVTVGEEYPRIQIVRRVKKDKSRYYGPYSSAMAVKDVVELTTKLYRLRTCSRNLPKDIGKERPCLYHQIHQCDAPCQGYISKEEYRKKVDKLLDFLNGNHKEILKELEEKMLAASQEMNFEDAAQYRDLIQSVKRIEGEAEDHRPAWGGQGRCGGCPGWRGRSGAGILYPRRQAHRKGSFLPESCQGGPAGPDHFQLPETVLCGNTPYSKRNHDPGGD